VQSDRFVLGKIHTKKAWYGEDMKLYKPLLRLHEWLSMLLLLGAVCN